MGGRHINKQCKPNINTLIIVTLIKTVPTKVLQPVVYHCCQLKSSLDPKTTKKPRMVPKMTMFPVNTSAHAPHSITPALAKTMGRPKAEMTMPVVRKIASSLQALLAESVSSTTLREIQYGIGERM